MARPVRHGPDERPRLAEPLEEGGDHVAVRHLGGARHVVRLAGRAVAEDVVDRPGVVGHEQPVALLEAVAVHRQRQVVDRVRDEQRDQLLGMVERAVRVRAAGHDGVDAVGHDVAPDEQLAGGLGGRVRRARVEPVGLARMALGDRAVDLVGRDLEVADRRLAPGGPRDETRPDRLEQDVDADDPGPQERLGIEDAPVDVGLGGEVDDRVGVARRAARRRRDRRCRPATKRNRAACSGIALDGGEVGPVAGVGQLVEDGDPGAVARGPRTSRT